MTVIGILIVSGVLILVYSLLVAWSQRTQS
jgi:hypothetical protein